MRVSCVLNAAQLGALAPDLIVFPEGVRAKELELAHSRYPRSIVVGAIVENTYCRGVLLHHGRNQIDYLKVGSDGDTNGSAKENQRPVYESDRISIGVLICMDVQRTSLLTTVVEQLKLSKSGFKVICIPSNMSADWFGNDELMDRRFEGIHVVLSNITKRYGLLGCSSFVTDTHLKKVKVRVPGEPIHCELP